MIISSGAEVKSVFSSIYMGLPVCLRQPVGLCVVPPFGSIAGLPLRCQSGNGSACLRQSGRHYNP
ncbi:MAG: hypothetical protein II684_06605 [Treponema sp.]|nr:hypothetical protein [Treponema sp.]